MIYFLLFFIICVLVWYISRPSSAAADGQQTVVADDLQMFGCKDSGYYLSVWPKVSGIGSVVEIPIAGVTFRSGVDAYLGEFVGRLVPEPNNPYDSNAIRIEAPDGTKVGYVPKDRTNEVRGNVKLPCSCCCFIARRDDHYITCCYIKV